jgi:TATA-binding protein-associated factor
MPPVTHAGWHTPGGSGLMTLGPVDAHTVQEALQSNRKWLHAAISLLLCLLVLDRFADYMADQVTAPVRETAAQALACGAAALPMPQKLLLLRQLVRLQTSHLWEVRQAALSMQLWLAFRLLA